jgi:hypothetical protein
MWIHIAGYNYTGSDLLHDGFVKAIDNRICYRSIRMQIFLTIRIDFESSRNFQGFSGCERDICI